MRSPHTKLKSSPHSPQPDKDRAQPQRPSAAKLNDKFKTKKKDEAEHELTDYLRQCSGDEEEKPSPNVLSGTQSHSLSPEVLCVRLVHPITSWPLTAYAQ